MSARQSSASTSASAIAKAMWADDHASQALGMQLVTATPGHAEMTMTIGPNMINGHGVCHGGYIFTLADSAFAFACNSHDIKAVAIGARIDFLAPGRLGDRLTVVAEQVTQGKRAGVYDAVVKNQNEVIIALFRGNSRRINDVIADAADGGGGSANNLTSDKDRAL